MEIFYTERRKYKRSLQNEYTLNKPMKTYKDLQWNLVKETMDEKLEKLPGV